MIHRWQFFDGDSIVAEVFVDQLPTGIRVLTFAEAEEARAQIDFLLKDVVREGYEAVETVFLRQTKYRASVTQATLQEMMQRAQPRRVEEQQSEAQA